jgi:hypothetical protein
MRVLLLSCVLTLPASAQILPPLNYTLSANENIGFYGYDDNGYVVNGLGDPIPGALSGGLGDLSDAAFGQQVFGGYSNWSPYVLWDGTRPSVSFDFGSAQTFSSVTVHGLSYASAAVYSVSEVRLRTSFDGLVWSDPESFLFSDLVAVDVPYALNIDLPFDSERSGRYLEVYLGEASYRRWIAVSEIMVTGSPAAIPEPAAAGLLVGGGVLAWAAARRRRFAAV